MEHNGRCLPKVFLAAVSLGGGQGAVHHDAGKVLQPPARAFGIAAEIEDGRVGKLSAG
jgi:hypothetical protein